MTRDLGTAGHAVLFDAVQRDILACVSALPESYGAIAEASERLIACLSAGGTVFACGNGGSAAAAQHLVAELVGRFLTDRPGLPAIALSADGVAVSALANDFGYEAVFSRQIAALAKRGDVLVAFSTSGKSRNVLNAMETALRREVAVIGLTRRGAAEFSGACDLCLMAPSVPAPRIQEMHLMFCHLICALVNEVFSAPGAWEDASKSAFRRSAEDFPEGCGDGVG